MPVLRLPKFGQPVKYAYITGRVRAMKTKLIPAEMYPRMQSMDASEIARYLEDAHIDASISVISFSACSIPKQIILLKPFFEVRIIYRSDETQR